MGLRRARLPWRSPLGGCVPCRLHRARRADRDRHRSADTSRSAASRHDQRAAADGRRASARRPSASASDRRDPSSTWKRAPRGAFEQTEPGRAVMDQRNETFVPHVSAITTGTTVDFPNSDRIYHNVFSLSKTGEVRPRPLSRRAVEGGPLRSARHRARVLRHPLAHERLHPGFQPSVLRLDRHRGPLPHRQRAAGHLQRRGLERRGDVRPEAGHSSPTAARQSSISRSDEAALVAAQPHLPRQRAADRAVASASRSISSACASPGGRKRRCSARSSRPRALVDQLRTTRTETFTRWRASSPTRRS